MAPGPKVPLLAACGLLGRMLVAVRGYDPEACARWSALPDYPIGQRILAYAYREAAMAEYYSPATTTARREAVKALFMGGESGVRWATGYAADNPYSDPSARERHFMHKRALWYG